MKAQNKYLLCDFVIYFGPSELDDLQIDDMKNVAADLGANIGNYGTCNLIISDYKLDKKIFQSDRDIKIVKYNWIKACKDQNRIVELEDYLAEKILTDYKNGSIIENNIDNNLYNNIIYNNNDNYNNNNNNNNNLIYDNNNNNNNNHTDNDSTNNNFENLDNVDNKFCSSDIITYKNLYENKVTNSNIPDPISIIEEHYLMRQYNDVLSMSKQYLLDLAEYLELESLIPSLKNLYDFNENDFDFLTPSKLYCISESKEKIVYFISLSVGVMCIVIQTLYDTGKMNQIFPIITQFYGLQEDLYPLEIICILISMQIKFGNFEEAQKMATKAYYRILDLLKSSESNNDNNFQTVSFGNSSCEHLNNFRSNLINLHKEILELLCFQIYLPLRLFEKAVRYIEQDPIFPENIKNYWKSQLITLSDYNNDDNENNNEKENTTTTTSLKGNSDLKDSLNNNLKQYNKILRAKISNINQLLFGYKISKLPIIFNNLFQKYRFYFAFVTVVTSILGSGWILTILKKSSLKKFINNLFRKNAKYIK